MTTKFSKAVLQELANNEYDPESFEVVRDEICDTRRWAIRYEMIFWFEDKYYQTFYEVGATEYQDISPYEFDPEMIEVTEVEPYEKTITAYRKVAS